MDEVGAAISPSAHPHKRTRSVSTDFVLIDDPARYRADSWSSQDGLAGKGQYVRTSNNSHTSDFVMVQEDSVLASAPLSEADKSIFTGRRELDVSLPRSCGMDEDLSPKGVLDADRYLSMAGTPLKKSLLWPDAAWARSS